MTTATRSTSAAASGADSIVVDLEEPRTPYPEPERERGRAVAREFFDDAAGALTAALRACAAAVDRADPQGPPRRDRARTSRASCVPKIETPADVHAADALLTCMEVELRHRPRQLGDLPDPRDRAGAIRLAYEIATASPRVAYMGGAISRFGDIHQAIGFRWTAEGEETLFLRSKVLVDAKAAGIRYPISGMWGGGRDDLDGAA